MRSSGVKHPLDINFPLGDRADGERLALTRGYIAPIKWAGVALTDSELNSRVRSIHPDSLRSDGCGRVPTLCGSLPAGAVTETKIRLATRPAATARKPRPAAEPTDPRKTISAASRKILDEFRLEEVTSHLLRRAHFAAEELFAHAFADESITPRQKAALVMLYQHPGLNQHALADRLFMDRNTVAEMARRLALAGLILRTPARGDQRAYQLFLAPDGAALLDRVMPRDVRLEQQVMDRLPPEYRPLFIKCIRLLIEPRPAAGKSDTATDAPPAMARGR